MKMIKVLSCLIVFNLAFTVYTHADPIDVTKPTLCSLHEVYECNPYLECDKILPEYLNLPDFININFKDRMLKGKRYGEDRKTPIEIIEIVDNLIILGGAEDDLKNQPDGLGWTMSIVKDTGRLTISAAANETAYSIFGVCTSDL